jgi:hypothetical protein
MRTTTRALLAGVALIATIGATIGATPPAGAAITWPCTVTWETPTSGSWADGSRWSTGRIPRDFDHVCITVPGDYTVTDAAPSRKVDTLRVGAADGTTTQTLVLLADGDTTEVVASRGVEISPRGVVRLTTKTPTSGGSAHLRALGGTTIANAGTVEVTGDPQAGHRIDGLLNTGILSVETQLLLWNDLTNDGTIETGQNAVIDVPGTLSTRSGTASGPGRFTTEVLRVGAMEAPFTDGTGPTFEVVRGRIFVEGDGAHRIDVTTGTTTITGTVRPDQMIRVIAPPDVATSLRFSEAFTNQGTIELRPGADGQASLSRDSGPASFTNEGTVVRVPAEGADAHLSTSVVNSGLIATSGGRIRVEGSVSNDGTIDLGQGELDVSGTVDLSPTSTVRTDVTAGDEPGDAPIAGRITAGGGIADGVLVARTIDPERVPEIGSRATVVVDEARTGTFDDVLFEGPATYLADPTDTGIDLVRIASGTATERFVRAAYQDFLGRQPEPDELSNHAGIIDGGTGTRAGLVRSLSRSEQYVTTLVQRFYADTLGRPGDPAGVAFWADQLISGRRTVAEVAGSFYASDEYHGRAGGTDPAWITALYDVFFERPPSDGDLAYWTNRIAERGRTRVAIELFQSLESRRQRVQRLYQDLLGRDGEPSGVDFWADRIATTGDLALAVNLAASAEYLDRAQTRYP